MIDKLSHSAGETNAVHTAPSSDKRKVSSTKAIADNSNNNRENGECGNNGKLGTKKVRIMKGKYYSNHI